MGGSESGAAWRAGSGGAEGHAKIAGGGLENTTEFGDYRARGKCGCRGGRQGKRQGDRG